MSDLTPVNSINNPWDNPEIALVHTQPEFSNVAYVHYADLNEFIKRQAKEIASDSSCVMLDYGAGSSPYRKYFPLADYRRADITGTDGLQYHIGADSTIKESDGTFDVILSTQVAEHVINPDVYFKECFRLLKPGGRLILTTHGIWEEHGSPYDFQRWTEEGLKRDLTEAGFKQPVVFKLTCGLRAALFFFGWRLFSSTGPKGRLPRVCFKAFRFCYGRIFSYLNRLSDRWLSQERIVSGEDGSADCKFYIVIATVARK